MIRDPRCITEHNLAQQAADKILEHTHNRVATAAAQQLRRRRRRLAWCGGGVRGGGGGGSTAGGAAGAAAGQINAYIRTSGCEISTIFCTATPLVLMPLCQCLPCNRSFRRLRHHCYRRCHHRRRRRCCCCSCVAVVATHRDLSSVFLPKSDVAAVFRNDKHCCDPSVSYTHLTLPTIYSV